ncbi:BRCT domain-containing protein [Lactiplantibacillus plantarum]|uniref:BRCT domain-containing protein n=1 Tax=Lactiplantibacillus plantarum TaxID=1590 RepID=UPI003F53B93D
MQANREILDLSNECLLFTGTLTGYTRQEAQQLVIDAGGKVLNYCSQAVTLLVVGVIDKGLFEELTTRKLVWAQSKSIAIIGEAEFIQLIKRNI